MRRSIMAAMVGVGLSVALAGPAMTEQQNWGPYQVGAVRSGYTYAQEETRKMQDDDFVNPATLWVDRGAELWQKVDGEAGKSCATCHDDAAKTMADAGATYPVYFEPWGKMMNLEQRINFCRTENMKAAEWKWESNELVSMTTFVRHQSRGKPVNVKVDGPAAPFYAMGKEFYETRRGQLDMACSNCHEDNAGNMLRANLLSQGMSNGFPTYRLKWQGVGSLQKRLRGCNSQVRAEPYGFGADEYVNLELYLADRARGLPVETPAVRN